MFLLRMKSGLGAGICAVILILGAESLIGFQMGRDPYALLVLLAGAWGSALPVERTEHSR